MEKIGKLIHRKSVMNATIICLHISADAITPLLDNRPVNIHKLLVGSIQDKFRSLKPLRSIFRMGEPITNAPVLYVHEQ